MSLRFSTRAISKIEFLSVVNCDVAFGVANEIPSIVNPADCSVATDAPEEWYIICLIESA